MRLTCTYSVQDDGAVWIVPEVLSGSTAPESLRLSPGPEASFWLAVAELAQSPPELQRAVLNPPAGQDQATGRIHAALSAFARMGLLRLEDSFVLEPWRDPEDIPPLRKLHLEITHRCNFACRACYVGTHLKRPGDPVTEATATEWAAVIDVAARLGCQFATVTGGEPFLRRDALSIVTKLSDTGIMTEINTNGSCITPRLARRLSMLRIYSVEVSLYGYSDISAQIYTDNARSYSAPLRGILALRDAGVPFNVKYFATNSSIERFEAARAALAEMGVEPRLVGRFIHGDIYKGDVRAAQDVSVPLPTVSGVQASELPCYPSVNALAIEPDGRIRACPKLGLHFGNVFVDGLDTIWRRSTRLKRFREFWPIFTQSRGYVKGATREQLCPAAEVLSTPGGFRVFRSEWEEFAGEESNGVRTDI